MADTPATVAPVTVQAVLDLEEVRRGRPEVLTGARRLSEAVSWVHIAETEEVAALLEGGEVILSSSEMFRSSPARTQTFLRRLAAAGAAAFVIEVVDAEGRPDMEARGVVAAAAEGVALPVIVLTARTRFVRITQAAHRLLIGAQLARVEFAHRIHEVFTALSLEGADEQRIVAVTAELADTPVVLEDARHRVLAFDGGGAPTDALLADWPREVAGIQVPVGVQGRRWGRLVAPRAVTGDADVAQILERAGQAITMARMASQGERDLLQQATVEFLHELMPPGSMGEERAIARAGSLGMRRGEVYVPVAIRLGEHGGTEPRDAQLRERALREEFGAAARQAGVPLLSGGLRSGVFVAILGLSADQDCDAVLTAVLTRVNASFGQPSQLLDVGVGRSSERITEAGAELESAIQVAGIVATMQVHRRLFHRFADVRLRGVIARLREVPVLRAFAEAELGPLLPARSAPRGEGARGTSARGASARRSGPGPGQSGSGRGGSGRGDAGEGGDPEALRFLEVLLQEGGNKTAVAEALHLSRPAVYARVRRLEERLGVSLEDAESRTSLHAALIWLRTEEVG